MTVRRSLGLVVAGGLVWAASLVVGAPPGSTAAPGVTAFPSSQTIPPTGALPPGGGQALELRAARDDHEGAWIVARGPGDVSASVKEDGLAALRVELAWGHFVRVGGRLVADALLPWNGSARAAEQPNQPLYVRVGVPRGASPGVYEGAVIVTVGGETVTVPLRVRVFPFVLPERTDAARSPLTSFHVAAPTYVNTVARLYGFSSHAERRAAHTSLYRFLATYRISPSSWGFGEPRTPAGYQRSTKWWLDSATNMKEAADSGFPAMRVPISSNRTAPGNWIGGVDPAQPGGWCDYLRGARAFWAAQGWLERSLPFLYALDEPDLRGMQLVAYQSKVLHQCWPGARSLMTGNPTVENRFLFDGRGGDDLDIWVVHARRYYGRWTAPTASMNRARELYSTIKEVRRTSTLWSYTYGTSKGTPGLSAVEPLHDPRMLMLWNALEGLRGLLHGQGTTNYEAGASPYDRLVKGGEFVLLYPSGNGPVPSARLEQLRDGLEDWAVLDELRRRKGDAAVRTVLGRAGLFSTSAKGTRLGCVVGCQLKTQTKFSWPAWSSDATTPARIEAARLAALRQLA
jgi:hypothetical protein